jgi:glycosyltransferase involved in cell wall biosynthesis
MIFSVVLPTYNRLSSLRQALESVLRQDFSDFEVIVVDDGSTDGTGAYLTSLADPRLRTCGQTNAGPAAARNHGVSMARGEFLAFTDDDCIVPARWLSGLYTGFDDPRVAIVGGAVRNGVPGNLFSQTSQDMTNHFVEILNLPGASGTFLTSNNLAYRRSAFEAAGGFDARFRHAGGEERALNHTIVASGSRSRYLSDCTVAHYHRMSLSGFLRQHLHYGRGAYLLQYVVTGDGETPFTPIPPHAYGSLIRKWFTEGIIGGMVKSALFLLAEGMALAGFCLQAVSSRGAKGVAA